MFEVDGRSNEPRRELKCKSLDLDSRESCQLGRLKKVRAIWAGMGIGIR